MKKILLANIGNRNIKYNRSFLSTDLFREETDALLQQYDVEKENIELIILPLLLDKFKEQLSAVYIFASDTPAGERNNQDTVYEGEIIKKILTERYGLLHVTVCRLDCRVVDTNALMQKYRSLIRRIKAAHPDGYFILCDAGGTAQQKSALKIIIEYLVNPDLLEVYNVVQDENKTSKLETVQSIEYRKVITQEQISALVAKGNYEGALEVMSLNQDVHDESLFKWLLVAAALKQNQIDRACALSLQYIIEQNPDKNNDLLQKLSLKHFDDTELGLLTVRFSSDRLFKLQIVLSIGQYYKHLSSFGFSILFHHIFLESFIYGLITDGLGYDLWNVDGNVATKHLEGLQNDIENGKVKPIKSKSIKFSKNSIPALLALLHANANEQEVLFLNEFKSLLSFFNQNKQPALDFYRNKFAHEGRTITKEEHDQFLQPFEHWYERMKLPKENIFLQLNKKVIEAAK